MFWQVLCLWCLVLPLGQCARPGRYDATSKLTVEVESNKSGEVRRQLYPPSRFNRRYGSNWSSNPPIRDAPDLHSPENPISVGQATVLGRTIPVVQPYRWGLVASEVPNTQRYLASLLFAVGQAAMEKGASLIIDRKKVERPQSDWYR